MAKFQHKERILKAAREKKEVTYKGAAIRLATDFSMETLSQKRMAKNIPSNEKQSCNQGYFTQQGSQSR